ncbi:pimeloyl-ACP methyl ester carboxylesterase [Psychromicrobium silvestre]|uniref:Pimeloyl-ACP methyl ester carboxylesterase n=1 Tax=Psychromicrobium silvestre TaxID=1645614 RepID=A0A7Y9LUV5_9MICC|nr:alpha/beta hydrolase [Psychromicrobium silvestre]NYE96011.1 pimeloyl-ACP methyl ester carboxylesterase [Psychromicrobium silvestre]
MSTPALLDEQLPDIDWSVLPSGSVPGVFEAPSGPLAMVSMGKPENPRVVLLPGATGSKEDFWFVMPVLAEAGYFVQSYDLAGQYESFAAGPENLVPPREHYDYELFLDDLLHFLEIGGPVHLLGYSFGGILGEMFTVRHPELVLSLVLLSTPPLAGQCFRGVKRIGRFSSLASPGVIAALMKWGIARNFIPVSQARLKFAMHRFELTRPDAHLDIMDLMRHSPDLRAELTQLPQPKFVAVGEHDLWPMKLHREFAQALGATLSIYPAGHSPSETTPYQLSRDLLALYGRLSR